MGDTKERVEGFSEAPTTFSRQGGNTPAADPNELLLLLLLNLSLQLLQLFSDALVFASQRENVNQEHNPKHGISSNQIIGHEKLRGRNEFNPSPDFVDFRFSGHDTPPGENPDHGSSRCCSFLQGIQLIFGLR
jgi:hypothetical protein